MPDTFIILCIVAIFLAQWVLLGTLLWKDGYKKGQIDAIGDRIDWRLVNHSDESKTWEKMCK